MAKPPESPELEKELRAIWCNAANTRKNTAPHRIESILDSSRAELALRDLFIFFIFMIKAFFMLLNAVLQSLFGRDNKPEKTEQQKEPVK